ncbi:MAG: hypothetical protein MJZ30_10315 [Paludibacteraceae bacterium]|nr:hypothetical protein [Paludibacteraceae bacterium]
MKKAELFVEGKSDKLLVEQYCGKLLKEQLINYEVEVHCTGGWHVIGSPQGESFRNIMKRNAAGKNLLILDADEQPSQRVADILQWKTLYQIDFELFLFPDNQSCGAVETLLERIINPANQCVIDCWHQYEDALSKQTIAWKVPPTPTCPSEKSKIYGYLEALVGKSDSEKKKIKDEGRDFTNVQHWDLDSKGILPLKEFLISHLR